jgi:hypothetical protein
MPSISIAIGISTASERAIDRDEPSGEMETNGEDRTGVMTSPVRGNSSAEDQPEHDDHRNRHADQPQQQALAHLIFLSLIRKSLDRQNEGAVNEVPGLRPRPDSGCVVK